MSHPPEKPTTDDPANSIASGAKRRDRLQHLLRTAQGNAANTTHKTSHKRPKPSLPPTPWDNDK